MLGVAAATNRFRGIVSRVQGQGSPGGQTSRLGGGRFPFASPTVRRSSSDRWINCSVKTIRRHVAMCRCPSTSTGKATPRHPGCSSNLKDNAGRGGLAAGLVVVLREAHDGQLTDRQVSAHDEPYGRDLRERQSAMKSVVSRGWTEVTADVMRRPKILVRVHPLAPS